MKKIIAAAAAAALAAAPGARALAQTAEKTEAPAAAAAAEAATPASAAAAEGAVPQVPTEALAEAPVPSPMPDSGRRTLTIKPGMTALVESISTEPTDFDFNNADVLGILRGFAAKFGKNIIAGPGVAGRVTLRLRGVPFDEAFRILLDQLGLVAVQKSPSVIAVIKTTDVPNLVAAVPLRYRFAQEVKLVLDSMLKDKEKERTIVSVDIPSNAIILTGPSDVLQKMKSTVDAIDVNPPQIAIKARLIEVSAGNSLNWGLAWSSLSNASQKTTVRTIDNMRNFTQNIDGSVNTNAGLVNFPDGFVVDVMAVIDKTKLYGLLNMIKGDSRTKTISEPSILTGNNKTAKIHVGQNLPVRTSQTTQTSTTQSIQYIPEGVDLEVTPIVSPGSNAISFQIKVGVSELVGFQDNNPITTERVAQTGVTVESGKTVVIGGLIKDKVTDSESGIPLLKDIPILGWLFKNKKKTKDRTELLIFITPELAADQALK